MGSGALLEIHGFPGTNETHENEVTAVDCKSMQPSGRIFSSFSSCFCGKTCNETGMREQSKTLVVMYVQ